MTEILTTDGLTKEFGTLTALDDVSLSFPADKTTSVIGPNGAGKTTLFDLITGTHRPTGGSITFKDEPIAGRPTHEIADLGILRSYQITNFFPELTVLENVRLAAQERYSSRRLRDYLTHYTTLESATEDAYDVLEQLELVDVDDRIAGELSHGQQRHLEIGIALAGEPELLLMDEPTAGMSPDETRETVEVIENIADSVTVALIEHDMDIVMDISDEIAVMNEGRVIARGAPAEISNDERVQQAYLGGGLA